VRCGTDCKSYTPHVFVTGDGHSWHDVTPPHLLLEIEDIAFSTPRAGWVVASDCAAAKAFFYRTKDGGRTWRRGRAPATNCAAGSRLDASFADARHGWILLVIENGSRVGLFRTHDGVRAGPMSARKRLSAARSCSQRLELAGWLEVTSLCPASSTRRTTAGDRGTNGDSALRLVGEAPGPSPTGRRSSGRGACSPSTSFAVHAQPSPSTPRRTTVEPGRSGRFGGWISGFWPRPPLRSFGTSRRASRPRRVGGSLEAESTPSWPRRPTADTHGTFRLRRSSVRRSAPAVPEERG
jgi:hypothetical protein